MKSRFLLGLALLGLLGCSGGGGGGSSSGTQAVSLKYSNQAVAGEGVGISDAPLPLFFSNIGVNAFYYRPEAGAYDPTVPTSNNIDNADWSRWDMVPDNTLSDFYLPSGGDTDIESLEAQSLSGNHWMQDISDQYTENVGVFSFDFIFLDSSPNVVLPDSTVCGANPTYPDQAYPTQNDVAQAFSSLSFFPAGQPTEYCGWSTWFNGGFTNYGRGTTVIARNDWFPSPVTLTYRINNSDKIDCWSASTSLSAFQIEILDSAMIAYYQTDASDAGYYTSGLYSASACNFSGYSIGPVSIFVSPETTNVPVVQFTAYSVPQPPTLTPGGNTVPQPPSTVIGASLAATVSFNLYQSDITNWSALDNSENYWGSCVSADCTSSEEYSLKTIQMGASANGAPWGLSVGFVQVAPPVLSN